MSKKAKLYDQVKIVANNSGHGFVIGAEVGIVSADEDNFDYLAEDEFGVQYYLFDSDIEPIKKG